MREALSSGRLVLTQSRQEQVRLLGKQLLTLATTGLLALLLWGGTRATSGDLRGVTYPVLGLLFLVAVLGALSVVRTLRRLRGGVRLEIDPVRARAIGFPRASASLSRTWADLFASQLTVPLEKVKEVLLEVHREAGRVRSGVAMASLAVVLEEGAGAEALVGPTAHARDDEWQAAEEELLPLGKELSRACGRALVIERPWNHERFTVES